MAGVFAAEVGADLLPGGAGVPGFEEDAGGGEEQVLVDGREDDGLGTVGANLRPAVGVADGHRGDVLHLACEHVVFRDVGAACAEDDLWVERVGGGVTVLDDAGWMPVAEADVAVVAAAGDTNRLSCQ